MTWRAMSAWPYIMLLRHINSQIYQYHPTMKEAFEMFDKAEDGMPDGKISTKELFMGLEKVGVTVGRREMELLVGKFDFDGSGAIEFNEAGRRAQRMLVPTSSTTSYTHARHLIYFLLHLTPVFRDLTSLPIIVRIALVNFCHASAVGLDEGYINHGTLLGLNNGQH